MFDGRTTTTYEITNSFPKPTLTHEQYAEINTSTNKEILENFNVASFFRRALNLEEDAADGEKEKDVSYTLYIAESKGHGCPKLKIVIGGKEVSALLDTGCELSILNEQLYNKLRLLGLNCLELPTQHLNLVSAFNERSKRIRKQALLEMQIGDSTVDHVVLFSPQLLTDAILGLDFLIDHAAEQSFPDRTVSLKINEKFCRLGFQGAREATRQEVAETSFKKQIRNFVFLSTLSCTKAPIPFALRAPVREQIQAMLRDGILEESYSANVNPLRLRPHRAQRTLCTGKIAAFTDNVRGHTKLHTLCTLRWRCSYVAVLFDLRLYFKTSLRTVMLSRPHAVTCSRQYLICCLLRQFRDRFN